MIFKYLPIFDIISIRRDAIRNFIEIKQDINDLKGDPLIKAYLDLHLLKSNLLYGDELDELKTLLDDVEKKVYIENQSYLEKRVLEKLFNNDNNLLYNTLNEKLKLSSGNSIKKGVLDSYVEVFENSLFSLLSNELYLNALEISNELF